MLDGKQTAAAVCAGFTGRFGEPLAEHELEGFVELARQRGFLDEPGRSPFTVREGPPPPAPRQIRPRRKAAENADPVAPLASQSILSWRRRLVDPDRFLAALAPRLWFVWTRPFLIVSAGLVLCAGLLLWQNRHELVSHWADAARWQTALLVWLLFLFLTALHELAHGLTCKHFGGEVHEIGVLLLFFTPCLYCNVSDAWLLREKSKRLLVTFAGGYWDLVL
jgi:fumarate reductase subunit D